MVYPNFKNKHVEEPLFNPHDFLQYKKRDYPNFPNKWIITWQKSVSNHLAKKYKLKKVKWKLQGEVRIKGDIGIIKMNGIGSPHAVTVFEEIIALGGKEFLLIGTAGGLKEQGIFLCEKSIRDEGTSSHYEQHGKYAYPDKSLMQKFGKAIERKALPYEIGTSWTIDAPYKETKAEVKKYKKEGVVSVEMESSAIFSVAKFRKVKVAGAFMISDVLGDEKWEPKFESKHMKSMLNKLIDAGFECLEDKKK
tara:strand:- start:131 stop:880 length:750 start_codon:yes stop_codon:yes gene_type:complete